MSSYRNRTSILNKGLDPLRSKFWTGEEKVRNLERPDGLDLLTGKSLLASPNHRFFQCMI